MGRKPTKNLGLPVRMRARAKAKGKIYYYYDHGGRPRKETPLGSDYVEAIRKWADLEQASLPKAGVITFKVAADRYTRDIIPTKATLTQRDNLKEIAKLLKFFNNPPAPLDEIEPIHVRQYLDWRGETAKTRANREKALLSHIWNCAREWGYTAKPNPCAGVRGHKEVARDVYVEDASFQKVYDVAEQPLRDAMDLALLTGQRPADLLKMSEADIKDGMLWIRQGKTGAKLRIKIQGELAEVIERIKRRKQDHRVRSLKLLIDNDGIPLAATGLRSKFDRAREQSGETWQFRDLRAKAGTEKEMAGGMGAAKDLLGHASETMTTAYVRHRAGKLVEPTK